MTLKQIFCRIAVVLAFCTVSSFSPLHAVPEEAKATKSKPKKAAVDKKTKKTASKSKKKTGSKKTKKKTSVPKGVFFSPKQNAAKAIAANLNAAKSSIQIAMYSLSSEGDIYRAMLAALKRKVKIKLILHKALSSNKPLADKLVKFGVTVVGVSRTMHHKFAIIDNSVLVTGSGNWSVASNTKFNEATMIFHSSKSLLSSFQKEFDYIYSIASEVKKSGKITPTRNEDKSREKPNSKTGTGAYFTSTNVKESMVVTDRMIKAINSAKKSVDIMVAHFNSDQLTVAIEKLLKKRNGNKSKADDLKIRVILDRGEYDDGKSKSKRLEKAGAIVRYKMYSLGFYFPRARLMHHKTIIVDNSLLLTGSFNFSETAETKNYENLLVISKSKAEKEQAALVGKFAAEFEHLWNFNRKYVADFCKVVCAKKKPKTLPFSDSDSFRSSLLESRHGHDS